MSHPRIAALLAASVCTVALTACGVSDDRTQARDVAARFAAALADDDGAAACAQLSAATAEALAQEERAACAEAVTQLGLDLGTVAQVRVYVTNAEAIYASGERAYLDRSADGWRLSAAGCRFEHGKPRSRPATCELESWRCARCSWSTWC